LSCVGVVYGGEGGERSLSPFSKRLLRYKVSLKALTLDVWRFSLRAIRARFPQSALLFDAFPILAAYSRMLDALRTHEYHKLPGPMRKLIKETRFLLFRGQEKHPDQRETPKASAD